MLSLIAMLVAVEVPPASSDAAQVIFFRSGTIVGSAISCAVHENGAKLTSLPPGKYAIKNVAPGQHDYVVASEAKDTWKIDAQAGQTYYAKCTVGAGFMAGHPHLNSSSEAEFKRMSEKLKPAKAAEAAEVAEASK
jgi:hypothetical protein